MREAGRGHAPVQGFDVRTCSRLATGKNDRELVATEAVRTDALLPTVEKARDLHEHLVPERVAVGVVDQA